MAVESVTIAPMAQSKELLMVSVVEDGIRRSFRVNKSWTLPQMDAAYQSLKEKESQNTSLELKDLETQLLAELKK